MKRIFGILAVLSLVSFNVFAGTEGEHTQPEVCHVKNDKSRAAAAQAVKQEASSTKDTSSGQTKI